MVEVRDDISRMDNEESGFLPDVYTSESILLGSHYKRYKQVQWMWSEFEAALEDEIYSKECRIKDRRFVATTLRTGYTKVFAQSPQFNEPDKIFDAMQAKDILFAKEARNLVRKWKFANQVMERSHGVEDYIGSRKGIPISPQDWKSAVAPYVMQPIDYDYVHGKQELDELEDFDWAEAMRDLMGDPAYNRALDRLFGDSYDDEEEEGEEPDLAEEVPDDEEGSEEDDSTMGEEYWSHIDGIIDALFPDEVALASDALQLTGNRLVDRVTAEVCRMPPDTDRLLDRMTLWAEEAFA